MVGKIAENATAATGNEAMNQNGAPGHLRLLTCGSVDDGKSTLIGRLLYEVGAVPDDQFTALERDSSKFGTTGGEVDFALLVDGLQAERAQGITIDVAYRFFATPVRSFIVADAPGHEQYTSNMATGASTADLAIVLVDARKGILTQTRRHAYIASLLGIAHIVLAVNKIDLVDYDSAVFERISADFKALTADHGFSSICAIPVSASKGDNVTQASARMDWYDGPTILSHIETVRVDDQRIAAPFRFPVQSVNRAPSGARGYCGMVASGAIRVGDKIVIARSGQLATVKRITLGDEELERAQADQSVTLVLEEERDISRGELLAAPEDRPHLADQFEAKIVWFSDQPLLPGRQYLLRTETNELPATVSALKYKVDVSSFTHEAAKHLVCNDIGVANIALRTALPFDSYQENPTTGAFVLIDRLTGATLAAGMITHPLWRAANVHLQALDIDRKARSAQLNQKPLVLWFTGLSGSGKSTIANLLEKRLHSQGLHTYLLDGDNIRQGLNRDLGFTEEDRIENIRRVAEVARLMADAGLIVLVSFISPFAAERRWARERMEPGDFVEVFVDTPFNECVRRDPKGLYAKARAGKVGNLTGVDSLYEAPFSPDIHLRTMERQPELLVEDIIKWLKAGDYLT